MKNRNAFQDDFDLEISIMPMSSNSSQQLSEFELIEHYFAPLAAPEGLKLKDDVACLTPSPGMDLVVTTDAVVEDIHFLKDDAPDSVARKALGVNISDLVAKGAKPRGFLLTLALPRHWTPFWLESFAQGLKKAAEDWQCPLLGGDTVRSTGELMISITVLGEVPTGRLPKRCDAQAGSAVYVTGTIGDAYLGLNLLQSKQSDSKSVVDTLSWAEQLTQDDCSFLIDRYHHPAPRTALIPLIQAFAEASMDVSDGLIGDFFKLANASGLGAKLDFDYNLLSVAGKKAVSFEPELFGALLNGGDDYEILFTVHPDNEEACKKMAEAYKVPLNYIGYMSSTGSEIILSHKGKPFTRGNRPIAIFESRFITHYALFLWECAHLSKKYTIF